MAKKSMIPRAKMLFRILVATAVVCAWSGLQWTYLSLSEDPYAEKTRRYLFENIGTGFLVGYIVIGLFIAWRHPLYWPFLNKVERGQLDERQKLVRLRVFELSYRSLAVAVVTSVLIFNSTDDHMNTYLWWFAVVSFFVLPVPLAAWKKDS
jgi:hypothetical protein